MTIQRILRHGARFPINLRSVGGQVTTVVGLWYHKGVVADGIVVKGLIVRIGFVAVIANRAIAIIDQQPVAVCNPDHGSEIELGMALSIRNGAGRQHDLIVLSIEAKVLCEPKTVEFGSPIRIEPQPPISQVSTSIPERG